VAKETKGRVKPFLGTNHKGNTIFLERVLGFKVKESPRGKTLFERKKGHTYNGDTEKTEK